MHVRALLELTSLLSEPLSSDEVAGAIVDRTAAAVGASFALMWTVDAPPTFATLVRSTGATVENHGRYARIAVDPSLPMGDAILRRQPLFFQSRAEYRERYPAAHDRGYDAHPGELSYACLPLVVHGRAIGGVCVAFSGARGFSDDERNFLTVLAHHAAQALERARLFERDRAARNRLEHLQRLTAALSSVATVDDIARLASQVATEALGLAAAVVWATDERGDLRILGSHGARPEVVESFRHIPADSDLPTARAAREKRPLYHERPADIAAEPPSIGDTMGRGESFRSYGLIPFVRDDRALGVLAVSAGLTRRFSEEERSFASAIAEHCADAIARARLYDEAKRAERHLQGVLECLPVGVIVARTDADILFTNDAMAQIWAAESFPARGVDRHKVLRACTADGKPLEHEDWPIMRAMRGEIVVGEELRITRLDGAEAWVQIRAAPIRRNEKTIEAAVATCFDVTAAKAARLAVEDASRAKDEFLAMLGHELRNPLAPMLTALHLMDLRAGGALAHERAVIERQVKRLARLVDDLLDVSRVVRGELQLDRAPFEVATVVADAIEVAGPLLEERKHRLTVSVPSTGLLVFADAARIAQALTNLLINASKYTPSGGRITVLARADARQVVVEVVDDGAGITPELLPVVFDAFTQGRQGLDRKEGGLGLGLAIARHLVVAHGGRIEARSAGEGRGTTMVVRLPRAEDPPKKERASYVAEAGMSSRRARCKVLLVDDNPDALRMLEEVLTEFGYHVRTAPDSPSALRVLEGFAPDIAFLDIGLPVVDGYELAQQMRRMAGLGATPLVAVTGYARDADRARAYASGFTEHLSKPLHPDRVLECIERLCPIESSRRP
jgi:PAS domain S-box-containing protein